MGNEESQTDCIGIMDGLNVGSRVSESCYIRDGNGHQNANVTGTFEVETKTNGDEYRGAGAQEGVPNPTRDGTMDLNTQQIFASEVVSINGIGQKGTGSDAAASIEVVGLNGFRSRVSQGLLTAMQPAYAEKKDIKHVALIPRSCEEESRAEEEGEFYVSDLVWGKVRSHPWWPGQIFEPSAASQIAMKYFKRDSYLIAYFGDQTFAWNEVSQIKPFRMYFNQMEKQSDTEAFCHAVDCSLDEVSRRVEFGLSCPCVPKAVQYKFKSQIVVNAGIRAESSQRDGGDKLAIVASFRPGVLLQHLKSIATAPCCVVDRLGFVVARSQLLAFSRWKDYYELPAVEEFHGLLEYDADTNVLQGLEESVPGWTGDASVPSGKEKSTIRDSSCGKRRRWSKDNECLRKKEKWMPGNISSSPDGAKDYKDETGRGMNILSSDNNHKGSDLILGEFKVKRRKKLLPAGIESNKSSPPKKFLRIGKRIQRAAVQLGGSTTVSKSGAEFPPLDEVLLKLSLAAKDPTNGYGILASFTGFFSGLRDFTSSENSKLKDHEILVRRCRGKSSSNYETTESSALDGIEDSYWTDRIIQGNFEEQVLYEPEDQDEKNTPVGQSDTVVGLNRGADERERGANFMLSEAEDLSGLVDGQGNLEEQVLFEPETQYEKNSPVDQPDAVVGLDPDADKQERDAMIVQSEAEDPSSFVDGEAEEDFPTELILNFKNLESVPLATSLNKIFSRFGPLDESQTEGMHKTKRAKVVFKRRSDAETAFSSAGKYSIFGPSLISYRLNYAPRPRKVPVSNRRRRKVASAESNDTQS